MEQINRRHLLALAGAGAVAAVLPAVVVAAPVPVVVPPVVPAWAIGTGGDWNWHVIEALTEDAAMDEYMSIQWGFDECFNAAEPSVSLVECECDHCHHRRQLDVERRPEWDGKGVVTGGVEWFNSGLGAHCSRCSYETHLDDCGHVVGREIVCEDCMTLADLDVVDPERAAELREDQREVVVEAVT